MLPAKFDEDFFESIKGFLPLGEANALYEAALSIGRLGPLLEIGAYCGRSAYPLGYAAKLTDSFLFSLDHHRGSEENQPGWPDHDMQLWDDKLEKFDSLPDFRQTIETAGLTDHVATLVGHSQKIAPFWQSPLALIFIDGGHSADQALQDYRLWTRHLISGGILAIHDVYLRACEGGLAPKLIRDYALASGLFTPIGQHGSLALLRRF